MHQTISVVTAVRNCLEETNLFLQSLEKFPIPLSYELILVDDGSEKETENFLKSHASISQLLRNERSMGFGSSNNQAVERSNGDWLLFMNNDLILGESWHEPFCRVVDDPSSLNKLGCLGNVQRDPRTNKIDHAGVTFAKGVPSHYLLGEKKSPPSDFSEFLAVTGACFMIRRELFFAVGGFDEEFRTGFEDIDLCLRLRMLGYRHYVANQSIIRHKRSSTPERNQHQEHNSKVFYGRWGKLMTRFEEWDRLIIRKTPRKTTRGSSYVLDQPEKFLFADRDLLRGIFSKFIENKRFDFAQKILVIFEENFSGDCETAILRSELHRKEGNLSKSEEALSQVENPKESRVLFERGEIELAKRNFTKARRIFSSLAKKNFRAGDCLNAIGRSYLEEGKLGEAEKAFGKSVLVDPESRLAWSKLAEIHNSKQNLAQEIQSLRKVVALEPENVEALAAFVEALVRGGLFRKVHRLTIRSKLPFLPRSILFAFARSCIELGDMRRGLSTLDELIKDGYRLPETLLLKGNLMVLLKQFKQAVACYSEALDFKPDWPEAQSNLANSKTFLCDWSERGQELENLQEMHVQEKILGGTFELAGLYWSASEEKGYALARSAKILDQNAALRKKLDFVHSARNREKKRLGFLSSDFRNHAVGHLIVGVLENLNRQKYEIYLYATSPAENSVIRRSIANSSDVFREIGSRSLQSKAVLINRDSLDLLVDLGGFSRGHNADLLALKPAPRQAHYLGYASSMGKGLVDYMIADSIVLPPSSSKYYGEKIIRMEGCFLPPGDFNGFAKRSKKKQVGLPSRGFVFCAYHAAYKLEPKIWSCWMRILKAVPESVLWLKFKPAKDALVNLKAEAVRQGISSKRIVMAEDIPDRGEHLSRMTVADLFLDCPRYNGHASAMDALHAKLPILTIRGNRFCTRVGESLARNSGLAELVAKDLKEYEKKAIDLGKEPSRLLKYRKAIQAHTDSALNPGSHGLRLEGAIDRILAMKAPASNFLEKPLPREVGMMERKKNGTLSDLTLVMARPHDESNWEANVNLLFAEISRGGGQLLILEDERTAIGKSLLHQSISKAKVADLQFGSAMNLGLVRLTTKYVVFLDDPLRVLPARNLTRCLEEVVETFATGKTGLLGIGSHSEPRTGCLVTVPLTKNKSRGMGGLFAPCFGLNMEALKRTGGFRLFGNSFALSLLDLSLRLEKAGYESSIIEADGILCPVRSGRDYLDAFENRGLQSFLRRWNRKPIPLKPKYPRKERQTGETSDYQEWIRFCDQINETNLAQFRNEAKDLQQKPLISVIMPVYDPPKEFLVKAIESVLSQAYENWELCIADDASTQDYVRPVLEDYAARDSRIKVSFRKANGHISASSNTALKLAKGEFVAFLDHDDELRPHSLLEIAKVLMKEPGVQLIYTDEDKINDQGERYDPYFKPDWDPELFLGQNYLSHLTVIRRDLIKQVKGFRKGFAGAQDWDLFLRVTERVKPKQVRHIPSILYHWRASGQSTALAVDQKDYVLGVARRCLAEAIQRRKILAEIKEGDPENSYWRIKYALPSKVPLVSILIPFRDRVELLETCLSSIRRTVRYPKYEIILLDNESTHSNTKEYLDKLKKEKDVMLVKVGGEFNYSKINNIGVGFAKGEFLLLLNNDVEAIEDGWFEEMVSHAIRPEVGCVGAKLLYPDNTIQHGGIFISSGGGPGHTFQFFDSRSKGYFAQLELVRSCTGVTAACLMVRKSIYAEVGGLSETTFKVAFNDVDFCLRVGSSGYINVWTPHARLYHKESESIGKEQSPSKRARFDAELDSLKNIWNLFSYREKNLNPNLHFHSMNFCFQKMRGRGLDKIIGKKGVGKDTLNQANYSSSLTFDKAYRKHYDSLKREHGESRALELVVGGDFEEVGNQEIGILKHFGLKDTDFIVDVGCGSGRLAIPLSRIHNGGYLGLDVIPQALENAKQRVDRRGWGFVLAENFTIPLPDEKADLVCFFSVFTHLLHEQSYLYLEEAFRVLKPGGKVVFSFLDVSCREHVEYFKHSLESYRKGLPLNVFLEEKTIAMWSSLLSFNCTALLGKTAKEKLGYPFSEFLQSLVCLTKPEEKTSASLLSSTGQDQQGQVAVANSNAFAMPQALKALKESKLKRLAPLLSHETPLDEHGLHYDYLPADSKSRHGIFETENVSSHEYDGHAMRIINSIPKSGWILDCGSGMRPTYHERVINFDPVKYPSTDVLGVGEQLPFRDDSFDAVFSLAVLEHVRNPFLCAREIARVLKPGGQLYCVVPFLSPYHGYPDHYYNMTKSGLANLFRNLLEVEKQEVMDSGHPIHTLTWVLRSWSEGLSPKGKASFFNKKVGELIGPPEDYFSEDFVSELPEEKKFELGATTALWARKPLGVSTVHQRKNDKESLVISLHVPKCGGSSFKVVLDEIYGPKLSLEYSQSCEKQSANAEMIEHQTECIHGHLLFEAYGQVMNNSRLITWLRHPVERTVSLYNHIYAHPVEGDELQDWVILNQPTLLEFAEFKLSRNYALGVLGHFSPEDFEFIGFLESVKSSMNKCASVLGWPSVPEFPLINRNSESQSRSLSKKEQEFIEEQNSQELKWYRQARKIFG